MLRLFGIGVLCAAATVILREVKSPVSRFLPLLGCLVISLYAVAELADGASAVAKLAEGTAVSEYIGTLMRAVGIGYAAELSADVCRGCGADSTASAILLLGRTELVALACPLLLSLLSTASSLL